MNIQTDQDGSRAVSSSSAVFRKIELHPARRKPFTGFSNRGSDFKMETLNPCSSNNNNRAFSSSPSVKKVDGPDSWELDRELTFTKTIRKIVSACLVEQKKCFLFIWFCWYVFGTVSFCRVLVWRISETRVTLTRCCNVWHTPSH